MAIGITRDSERNPLEVFILSLSSSPIFREDDPPNTITISKGITKQSDEQDIFNFFCMEKKLLGSLT